MNYKYFKNDNFEDYASGRVLYNKPGIPNFPVRLAGEIFCRCLNYLDKKHITLYDPCCGSSYMLTVLGLLNPKTIRNIVASDIDNESLTLSKSNLSLLSEEGLTARKKEIQQMISQYNKPSHLEALTSVNKFLDIIRKNDVKINIDIFKADILASDALINKSFKADIVITDVPYGNLVSWSDKNMDPLNGLLDNLCPILAEESIVAVVTDKSQKVNNKKYTRLEMFKAGKRRVTVLTVQK